MALPKITTPIYELTLPSNGKKISYRPFLVKEEKIILIAAESRDAGDIKKSILQVVRNCVLDEDFNVEQAATFDIEYILIHLRIKSVGEQITNEYNCNNVVNETRCDGKFEVPINLEDLMVIKEDKLDSIIELTSDMSIKMIFPKFSEAEIKSDKMFDYDLIINSMDSIVNKDKRYVIKETPKQEVVDFLDSLTKKQFIKINDYFDKLPKFEINKEIACPKCGFIHKIVIDDLAAFF